MKEVYVVGKLTPNQNSDAVDGWQLIGIFDDYEDAKKECKFDNYFCGPMKMNEPVHDIKDWQGCHYPSMDAA